MSLILIDKIPEILFTFSMIRHTRDLIKYDKSSNLNFINGWKFATMMMVIFGHTILSGSHVPLMYAKVAEKVNLTNINYINTRCQFIIIIIIIIIRFLQRDHIFY